MSSEIITLENICKSYSFSSREFKDRGNLFNLIAKKRFHALQNTSFSISKGESVAFLGKNGAGKTILLKIISGIIFPTSGKVIVKKAVSPIFEYGAGFHPELSGMENIFLYGALLGIRKKMIDARLNEIVKFSELGDFLDFKLKHYSTGMKVRLALSVVSVLNSEILILDEALSAGDQGFVRKVHDKIFELQKKRVTMLITSHSSEILKKFCTRGVVLEKGRILFDGEISYAIKYYLENILMEGTVKKLENSLVHS